MSHLGRPDGKKNEKYSLKPVVPELEKLLGKKVIFTDDCVGKEVEDTVNGASDGQVILLENLRFHAEEEGSSKDAEGKKVKADKANVDEFRKGLTALGDIYISTSHDSCLQKANTNDSQMMLSVPHTELIALWSELIFRKKRRACSSRRNSSISPKHSKSQHDHSSPFLVVPRSLIRFN